MIQPPPTACTDIPNFNHDLPLGQPDSSSLRALFGLLTSAGPFERSLSDLNLKLSAVLLPVEFPTLQEIARPATDEEQTPLTLSPASTNTTHLSAPPINHGLCL